MIVAPAVVLLQAATLVVGTGGYRSVSAALAAAAPGDTVQVRAGVYREHPVVTTPVVLLGEPGAVLDGGREGVVLTVRAPAVIRGLTIRRSGRDQAAEHGGILAVGADGLVVADNRLEDVLFGIYVKDSRGVVIRGNTVVGKDFPLPLRGDGIRLWSSPNGVIEDNDVRRVRDVVVWFSNGAAVRRNRVAESRYGLHYMYSHHSTFDDNAFHGNHVGAFIMYSRDITFRGNVFAGARGTAGRGLGFKDSDGILAEGNALVKNAVGISLDNSPSAERGRNVFRENLLAYNDVAVVLLPSVHSNDFLGNVLRDNLVPVRVTGGGTALANRWVGNYWSDYAGFDADGDGTGDAPYVLERLSGDLLARHEALQAFTLSPALGALDVIGRVLPLLAPEPIVVDSAPRLRAGRGPAPEDRSGGGPVAPLLLCAVGLAAGAAAARFRRVAGRPG